MHKPTRHLRVIRLPGGYGLQRRIRLFWRIRLPMWALLAFVGRLVAGRFGAVLGLAVAFLAEVVISFGRPDDLRPIGPSRPPPHRGGGSAGVREPRRPHPTQGAGPAQLPLDPLR